MTHFFTVDDFHRMAEAGVFAEDDRLELLEGEIVQMTPIATRVRHFAPTGIVIARPSRALGGICWR